MALLLLTCLSPVVVAQQRLPSGEFLHSLEGKIHGRIWLRTSEENEGLVSHVQMGGPIGEVGGSFDRDGSLNLLQKLPPVTELDTSLIQDDEVSLLAKFSELRKLRFSSYASDNRAMPSLPALAHLEHLEISLGFRDERELMRSLARQPELRHLSIWCSGLDEDAEKATKILTSLKDLSIETLKTENGLGTSNLRDVAEIKSLRTLVFEYTTFTPDNLEILGQLPHLETLVIPGAKLDDADFEALSGFPSLQRLIVSGPQTLTVNRVQALSHSNTLHQIEAIDGGYSDNEREAFQKQFPQARFVFFGPAGNPLADLDGATVQPFRIVRETPLGLSMLDRRGPSHFNSYLILETAKPLHGDDATRIREILVDPETYNVNGGAGCFVPGLGLRFTKGEQSCDALVCLMCQSVSLMPPAKHLFDESTWYERNGGSIGEEGRRKLLKVYREIFGDPKEGGIYLRASPELASDELLQELNDYVELDLAGDQESKKFAPLVSMNFTNCQFTGIHLAAIKPLVELQELRLNGTSINDDDLGLLEAQTALKILDLSRTKVTEMGVTRFMETHPETKVIHDSR